MFEFSEILNIHYRTGIIVLNALNKFPDYKGACQALGISEKTLIMYRYQYRINYNRYNKKFEICLQKKFVYEKGRRKIAGANAR